MRVASLDIGSNTALMLVAEQRDGGWERVEDHAEICRVSEGLDASGVLARDAVARTRTVIARYAARAAELGVDRIVATGTAPFRRASNGADVAVELSHALGATVDVVSGEREADLALLATRDAFREYPALRVVDIGGASTEIIAARADGERALVSMDLGSVRLTERCVGQHPWSRDDRSEVRAAIGEVLGNSEVRALLGNADGPLVGIAGTVTTLCAASLELSAWDPDRVHGHALSVSEIDRLATALSHLSVAQRAALPGISPKRADVLPSGAALLSAIAVAAGVDEVLVSDRGVRWGRLVEVAG